MAHAHTVSKEESRQKILNYLLRKFEAGTGEAHKWIRTGQVRINGKRCQPFDRVNENDEIRVPPFAQIKRCVQNDEAPSPLSDIVLEKIYEDENLLVIDKPHGIPVQSGSKQQSSITKELKKLYPDASFAPTPAHRLDKTTSGLLLIAKSYETLFALQQDLQDKENSNLEKIYLAVIEGFPQEGLWQDTLIIKRDAKGREKTFVAKNNEQGQVSLCEVKLLSHQNNLSLIQVRLITGRKHQIRAQCAHRGTPIHGDVKYNASKADRVYLHAHKLVWKGQEFISPPPF